MRNGEALNGVNAESEMVPLVESPGGRKMVRAKDGYGVDRSFGADT